MLLLRQNWAGNYAPLVCIHRQMIVVSHTIVDVGRIVAYDKTIFSVTVVNCFDKHW